VARLFPSLNLHQFRLLTNSYLIIAAGHAIRMVGQFLMIHNWKHRKTISDEGVLKFTTISLTVAQL